jgi:hypothetical protein
MVVAIVVFSVSACLRLVFGQRDVYRFRPVRMFHGDCIVKKPGKSRKRDKRKPVDPCCI